MVKQTQCITSQIVSFKTFRNSTQLSSITEPPEVRRQSFVIRPPWETLEYRFLIIYHHIGSFVSRALTLIILLGPLVDDCSDDGDRGRGYGHGSLMIFKLLDERLHHVSMLLGTTAAPYCAGSSTKKGLLQGHHEQSNAPSWWIAPLFAELGVRLPFESSPVDVGLPAVRPVGHTRPSAFCVLRWWIFLPLAVVNVLPGNWQWNPETSLMPHWAPSGDRYKKSVDKNWRAGICSYVSTVSKSVWMKILAAPFL